MHRQCTLASKRGTVIPARGRTAPESRNQVTTDAGGMDASAVARPGVTGSSLRDDDNLDMPLPGTTSAACVSGARGRADLDLLAF